MAGREELLAEVSGFLAWCEDLDASSLEVAHDVVRRQLRTKAGQSAVEEVGASRMQVTFISALGKAVAPVARHFADVAEAAELPDGSRVAARVRLAASFAAQAVRQRERLSVGSYLVLTEPFRVAGFDFEDGWGVGPDAEGVVTTAPEGDSGSVGGGGSGRGSGDGEGVS